MAETSAEIENVGDAQQRNDSVKQRLGIVFADVFSDALAGDPAQARTDFLDRRHQRKRKQHGPQHARAELRADLGVRGDAARIVVRGAGDQAWAEAAEKTRAGGARSWLASGAFRVCGGRRHAGYFFDA